MNLDVADFQPNKSTTQIWVVTHHHYEFLGSFLGCHVEGRGRSLLGRQEMLAFFFLRLPVLKFASIRTKPSLGVKEDQRKLTVNPSL